MAIPPRRKKLSLVHAFELEESGTGNRKDEAGLEFSKVALEVNKSGVTSSKEKPSKETRKEVPTGMEGTEGSVK